MGTELIIGAILLIVAALFALALYFLIDQHLMRIDLKILQIEQELLRIEQMVTMIFMYFFEKGEKK